jgi:hypothetical protein
MVTKSGLTPLTKNGTRTVHAGKGAKSAPMGMRQAITQSGATQPGAGINDYAKATPVPGPAGPAPGGLGSGTWPGIGG